MNRGHLRAWLGGALTLVCWHLVAATGAEPDSARVKKLFRNPPRDYSTGPLWVWNDRLTEEQIRSTLRDLAAQRIQQVWVHPRPGLMTPYLSEDWFRLWRVALDEARRLDMNVWIYDENSYPSGFAGGWVPEQMPDSCGRGVSVRETNAPPPWSDALIAVLRVEGDRAENVTPRLKAGEALPTGRYFVATLQRAQNAAWTAGRCYVDLLMPGVTEKFIEVTLEPYRRRFGSEFGRRIPGVFTDEPNLRSTRDWPWTTDLPEQFQQRRGYDLIEHLPALVAEVGDWKRVRHDYWWTVHELFIERWARPFYEYCASNRLELTGHYWEHEWPRARFVPDNMAMAAWQQRPGIDILMNRYEEHTYAQFGNVRACREISSLANQLGGRTLVELYGAAGWDLRFEDMKRIGDWLQVLGVNTLNQHLSFVTLRGARKRDHPLSFSYHAPWWDAYHVQAQYFARLSAALCQGEQINRILIIEPTRTAWMYQGHEPKLAELGEAFFKLLLALEAAQIEYDLGCEDVIAEHGAAQGRQLRVGRRAYDVVVIPPHTENLSEAVVNLGEEFLTAGGAVVCLGEPPSRINGQPSSRVQQGANEPGWISAPAADAPALLQRWNGTNEFHIRRAPGDRGILFHMRRQLADGQLLFLVNTSAEFPSAGEIRSALRGVERWDAYTGEVEPYPFERAGDGVRARFELPPSGSLLLFLSKQPLPPPPAASERREPLAALGPMQIRRLEPNVLTLDYVDVTVGAETRSNVYFYAAQQWVFQKHGLPRNPWDNAVQFKDEIL
ncbi:MAG: glycosyl hydrolase, partial [Verrucomicrobiae bacterium]|nr:glycosyl hydrolase [Verrucomicrobiae bacterium]